MLSVELLFTPFGKGGRRALSEAGGFCFKDFAVFFKSPLAPLFQRGEQEKFFFKGGNKNELPYFHM